MRVLARAKVGREVETPDASMGLAVGMVVMVAAAIAVSLRFTKASGRR
jgi:hypothetical protein